MSPDLEHRLRSHLRSEAAELPPPTIGAEAARNLGATRRRRTRIVTGLAVTVLAAGTMAGLVGALNLLDRPAGTVVADQPDRPDQSDPPDQSERGATSPDDGTSPSVTEAIAALPDAAVLFHSDLEGCEAITDRRGHPDWIEGQALAEDVGNEDGSPTYGFAYTSGGPDDMDWGFVPGPDAPSGDCVLAMTLNRADIGGAAVRLFRRYDRNGEALPADAYYSVWLRFPTDVEFDGQAVIDGETVFGFWNILQFRNEVRPGGADADLAAAAESMSTLSFLAGRTPDEPFMSFHLFNQAVCGDQEQCDEASSITQNEPIPIPLDRWVHLEIRLRADSGDAGLIQAWQDGQPILDVAGPNERVGSERRTWSLHHNGRLHRTAQHTLFADDPAITTTPLHPTLFGDGGSAD